MSEPERSKEQPPVEASAPASHDGEFDERADTPMMAVWLSLAAILLAGLYGLYLGTSAKKKANADAGATSFLSAPINNIVSESVAWRLS